MLATQLFTLGPGKPCKPIMPKSPVSPYKKTKNKKHNMQKMALLKKKILLCDVIGADSKSLNNILSRITEIYS